MPLKAIDYSNTYFYKIVCKGLTIKDAYVGHTTDFKTRKNRHKQACVNPKRKHHYLYVYQFIRENNGWDNWEMVLIDTLELDNRLQVLKKEREYIEQLSASLNQARPFTTDEEREEVKKTWRGKNRDKLNKQLKVINDRLRKEHPERFKEYDRKKREIHGDKMRERQKEKVVCECGAIVCRSVKARHQRTKKHQEALNSLNNINNVSSESNNIRANGEETEE